MNVWEQIDAMHARYDAEIGAVRAALEKGFNKRAANTAKCSPSGVWSCSIRTSPGATPEQLTAPSSAELLRAIGAVLDKQAKAKKQSIGLAG